MTEVTRESAADASDFPRCAPLNGVGGVRHAAYVEMQRAMVMWEVFGDFTAAADYYAARRRWLAIKEKQ
jgi:hypothetical protein